MSAIYNAADMLEGFRRIHQLADSPALIIPGHDAKVLQRFRAPLREFEGWVARLEAV
ncbi:hypothetical protein D3C86_2033640 [compost metagenome]